MLQRATIESKTLELLRYIQSLDVFSNLRLVGGTALALQLGHRKSVDLDFFGIIDFRNVDFANLGSTIKSVTALKRSDNINVFNINGIKVDFVNYSYPWLEDKIDIEGIAMASIKDIGAMKIAAITNRGSRKDFVDIYFLLENYTLKEIISFYEEKFRDASKYLALKSLSYFEDAEKEPMPVMLKDFSWGEAKEKIIRELKFLS